MFSLKMARWSSGLRHRPFTAVTRVRIPYGSPFRNLRYEARSPNNNLNRASCIEYGRLAQLGERLPYKQDVGSSILSSPTKSTFEVRGSKEPSRWTLKIEVVFEHRISHLEYRVRPRGVVVNMPACHAGDRRFKSDRGRHMWVGGRVVKGGRL